MMGTIIVIILLIVIIGMAIRHIYKKKKSGGCIGCPQAGSCNGNYCSFKQH